MLARDSLPAVRPVRTGAICLTLGLLLAMAAGTLALGPGDPRPPIWTREAFEVRGGAVGESMYWAAHTLASQLGAHIAALFLTITGVILLSGATVAGLVRTATLGVADTGRAAARARLGPPPRHSGSTRDRPAALYPPEPVGEEVVVHAAAWDDDPEPEDDSVTAPLWPEEPEEEPEAVEPEFDPEQEATLPVGPEDEPTALTPQGRYRAETTEDPSFVWKIPSATKVLTRSKAEDARPDTAGQAQTATGWSRRSATSASRPRSWARSPARTSPATSCASRPASRSARSRNLKDDLAYALAAADIRIQAPIPGKQAVGVEVPNLRRKLVHLGDVCQPAPDDWSPLAVWLGKDVAGRAIGADLAKMPHLLVAGTTGAGKSARVNAMLSSVLLRATPHEVRHGARRPQAGRAQPLRVDPAPAHAGDHEPAQGGQRAAEPRQARWRSATRSCRWPARARCPSSTRAAPRRDEPALPYILCVIDELADLMMVAPADVEDSIIRLAQKARAVGIHLVLATQSPRVDVITGMIKANVPSRIAFAVSSQTDSRVILDQNGAETLLGQGDMLFSPVGSSRLQRIQGAYIDEGQIAQITEFWRRQGEPEFREELLEEVEDTEAELARATTSSTPTRIRCSTRRSRSWSQMGTASTSMLQRRLRLGYTRAGRLIDMLERRGVISGYEGSKPRQVLITEADVPRLIAAVAQSVPAQAEPEE